MGVPEVNKLAVTDDLGAGGLIFLAGSAELNFPSIAAAGSAELTVACDGALLTDDVTVHPAAATGPVSGLVLQAWVSAADVVTIRATNVTGADVDPAALTYRVRVWRN